MDDAAVFLAILIVVGLVAWPSARRWLSSRESSPLLDPEQRITIHPIDGLPGLNEIHYRTPAMPRGRRHRAPPGAVVRRRAEADPSPRDAD
jgi:hypothetical protein